jgi:hypothetical protein
LRRLMDNRAKPVGVADRTVVGQRLVLMLRN